MTLHAVPLAPFGVEVSGESVLEQVLGDDEAAAEVRQLLLAHSVVVFRGLGLDDLQQVAVARRLGEPHVRSQHAVDVDCPEVSRMTLDGFVEDPGAMRISFGWHTDMPATGFPPFAVLLTARSLPAAGSITEFASLTSAYARLGPEERARFLDLSVRHTYATGFLAMNPDADAPTRAALQDEDPVVYPLVWRQRDGGRALLVGAFAERIEGLPAEESSALLAQLRAHVTDPRFVYRHQWRVGDLLIFHNPRLVHRARPYEPNSGRELRRVAVVGDETIGRSREGSRPVRARV